jgi:hypothetical protein
LGYRFERLNVGTFERWNVERLEGYGGWRAEGRELFGVWDAD